MIAAPELNKSNTYFEQIPCDPEITTLIQSIPIKTETLRSSENLNKYINEIIVHFHEKNIISSWEIHFVTIRIERIKRLLINQLCIPRIYDLIGIGIDVKSLVNNILSPELKGPSLINSNQNNLFLSRIQLIILEAFTLFKLNENYISYPQTSLLQVHKFQVNLFLHLMDIKSSPILPNALIVREYGTQALESLTQHFLSVTASCSYIEESIAIVIKTISNILSSESYSSLISDNFKLFQKILMGYFEWVQSNRVELIKSCRTNEIIQSVDSSLRAWLRNEQYSSPYDIIRVYNQKYRSQLTNLVIPLQSYNEYDLIQAQKDINREGNITINKIVYTDHPKYPDLSYDQKIWKVLEDEIRKILVFSFNIDFSDLTETPIQKSPTISIEKDRADELLEYLPDDHITTDINEENSLSDSIKELKSVNQFDWNLLECINKFEENSPLKLKLSSKLNNHSTNSTLTTISSSSTENSSEFRRLPSVEYLLLKSKHNFSVLCRDILHILHAYAMLAMSRTISMGDAYVILNDLYGGEGLALCPDKSKNNALDQSDIQVAITTSGFKVAIKEHYCLYPILLNESTENIPPLMRFECTTTTLLILSDEVLFKESSHFQDPPINLELTSDYEKAYRLFQILLTKPDTICHRAVNIVPYLI